MNARLHGSMGFVYQIILVCHVITTKGALVKSTYFIIFLCTTVSLHALTVQDTQIPERTQQIGSRSTTIPDFFYKPLEYSQQSFQFFLSSIYNHRLYPQGFLALNFLHVISGINLASQAEQPRRYMRKLFYLFDPKMQMIYINPYAFSEMLNHLPLAMTPFCNKAQEKRIIVEAIKETIGSCLVNNFTQLKKDPETTLNKLAQNIYALTVSGEERDISIAQLQYAFHYFLARGISNLVWSPSDQIDSWELVKTLSHQIEKCLECNLIDEEMVDDLFWVLLQRYAFFMDICAADLHQAFFDAINKDLRTERASLWLLEEREEFITTKLSFLKNALMEAEIKSRAQVSCQFIDTPKTW